MYSKSLFLGISPLLASASAFYVPLETYQGNNFFDKFNFFTDADPSGGYVDYKSQADAITLGLLSNTDTSAKWGVGMAQLDPTDSTVRGRPSVRLEGKNSYTKGLFITDIERMPGNACGIWPSFWTLGSGNWPDNGEIDIIEGVNWNTDNKYSLHSGAGTCQIQPADDLGTIAANNCESGPSTDVTNFVGCGIDAGTKNNFGTPFNNNGGGVYAMQWTDDFIKTWFFPRGTEPASLKCEVPDVTEFGTPDAFFSGCDIGSHFKENRLVFTTTFCGSWAGADGVYSSGGACPLTYDSSQPEWKSCRDQVALHPDSFSDASWEVNYIKVFSESDAPASSNTCPSSSSSSSASSSATSSASSSASSSTASSSSSSASASVSVSSSSSAIQSSSSEASSSVASTSSHFGFGNSSIPTSGHGATGSHLPTSSRGAAGSHLPTNSRTGAHPTITSGHAYTSSKGSYGNYNPSPVPSGFEPCKAPVTTVVVTDIVDVCPTGLTTSHITTTMSRCAMCHYEPTKPYEGFTTTVKTCTVGCGPKPTEVTVTVPCSDTPAAPKNGASATYMKPSTMATYKAKGTPTGTAYGESYPKPAAPGSGSPAAPVASTPVKPVYGAATPYAPVAPNTPGGSYSPAAPNAPGGSYSPAAPNAPGGSYSPAGPYAPAGNGTKSYGGATGTGTYYPLQATTNAAGRNVASAIAMIGAAVAAIMML